MRCTRMDVRMGICTVSGETESSPIPTVEYIRLVLKLFVNVFGGR